MRRSEYPRPQFVRKEWLCLNGTWDFSFDDHNRASSEHWEKDSWQLEQKIEVPFCFESRLSGIQDTSIHDRIFYKRRFSIPDSWSGSRILLHFEAVDYQCRVFVNEQLCAQHKGGNCGFSVDITDCLRQGRNHPEGQAILGRKERQHLVHKDLRHLAERMAGTRERLPYHPGTVHAGHRP